MVLVVVVVRLVGNLVPFERDGVPEVRSKVVVLVVVVAIVVLGTGNSVWQPVQFLEHCVDCNDRPMPRMDPEEDRSVVVVVVDGCCTIGIDRMDCGM